MAAKYNRPEIAKYLIRKGCWIHKQNSSGKCSLYVAAFYNSKKVMKEMDK